MNNSIRLSLFISLLLFAFPALADGPVIPIEAAIVFVASMAIAAFVASMLLSIIVKLSLQRLRKEKRKRIWLMSLTTFLVAFYFWYMEEKYDWLYYYQIEFKYGYETKERLYYSLFFLFALTGSIVGYFLTSKKENKKTNDQ